MTLFSDYTLDIVPLAVHIDSHMPPIGDPEVKEAITMILKCSTPVIQDFNLPAYLEKITRCSFATGKTPFRNVDPLVHVFSKAWPMRCSIRNFQDIVSNYVVKEHIVYTCMMAILHCFLSGNYQHARMQAPFEVQRILYKHFVWHPISAVHLSKWIRQGHQQIMFASIKEYIVYSIAQVPALQDVLGEVYPWNQFKETVITQSNDMREVVFRRIGTGDPFKDISSTPGVSKGVKCTHCCQSWKSVLADFLAVMRNVAIDANHFTTYPARYDVYQRIRNLGRDQVMQTAKALNIHSELANELHIAYRNGGWKCKQRTRARDIFTRANIVDQYRVHEFAHAWYTHLSAETYRLPRHIYKMQVDAVKKYKVSPLLYSCICCKQLRGFVVDIASASKTAWAKGNHKVLYDDYTGDLYCGRKVEKLDKGPGQSYWKYQQALMCKHGKLISHNLLGNILSLNGVMYSLCNVCACKMEITNDRYNGHGFCCIHCQYRNSPEFTTMCCHCMQHCKHANMYQCADGTMKICAKCTRCWIDHPAVRSMTQTNVHVAINERWTRNQIIARFG